MEATIGRSFFFGELFFRAFTDALEKAIQEIDRTLRLPQMGAQYLEGIQSP